jgi:uncharacterized protein YbbC (DUF1343 family)
MEEAAKNNLEFYVLDRPNPITGAVVEGEPLSPKIKHFTAYLQIPVRHGMTVGEIANWYNQTAKLNLKLHVIKMQGWTRAMWWKETGLKFRPPSPNIRTWQAALLYAGIGGFETTNVSVGRGTNTPFEIVGAPWMDGKAVAERLNLFSPSGFKISAVRFKPAHDLYSGEECQGIRIHVIEPAEARPIDLFVYLFVILQEMYPEQFAVRWDELERITGSGEFKQMLDMGQSPDAILEIIHTKASEFQQSLKLYLLY